MSNQVTMERRPSTFYEDVSPELVVLKVLKGSLIFLAISSTIIWLCFLWSDDPNTIREKNQKIEAFNKLPEDTRKVVKEVASELDWQDGGKATILAMEESDPLVEAVAIQIIALAISVVSVIIWTPYYYWRRKSESFFLADFPLDAVYGWVLLILCLPLSWPFVGISYIRMQRYFRKAGTIATDAVPEELETESNTDSGQPEEEKNETIKTMLEMTAQDQEAYIALRTRYFEEKGQRAFEELERSIKKVQGEIQNHSRAIISLQRELGKLNAKRQAWQEDTGRETMSQSTAISELEKIAEMRGVKEITPDLENHCLEILIQIRVPYKEALYDFGDYKVTFYYNSYETERYETKRIRCGVKDDATNEAPFYHNYGSFCFGDREAEIISYVEEGRIVEALTLIVDSMHSVNEGDEEYIPECFECISKPEKAQKET